MTGREREIAAIAEPFFDVIEFRAYLRTYRIAGVDVNLSTGQYVDNPVHVTRPSSAQQAGTSIHLQVNTRLYQ
jgi:hypothetical protein